MKLVICYSVGDCCTYSCDVVRPVEYESAEAAIVEFERLAVEARAASGYVFWFAGHEFDTSDFFWKNTTPDRLYLPEILTIDEWFAQPNQ
jgi:hypothetical protein